jgi:hypothetical protein
MSVAVLRRRQEFLWAAQPMRLEQDVAVSFSNSKVLVRRFKLHETHRMLRPSSGRNAQSMFHAE